MKKLELDNSKDFRGWVSREAILGAQTKKKNEDGSYPAVITTEQPATVVDWERWEIVREVLLMNGCIMPANKQLPLLDSHSRFATSSIKGSIRNLRIEGTDLVGDVHFWSKAEDEISKVEEGHLTDLSAGYKTYEEQTVEIKPGKEELVNGTVFKNDFGDNKKLLIRTRWEVKEGSLVAIGADNAAKFRSEIQNRITSTDPELQKKLDEATEEIRELKITIQSKGGSAMGEPTTKTTDQLRAEVIAEILEASDNYSDAGKDLAKTMVKEIREGKEVDANTVKNYLLRATDLLIKSGGGSNKPISQLDLSGKELKEFSATRAIQNMVNGKRSGDEFEMSKTLEDLTGIKCAPNEILLPTDIQNTALRSIYPELAKRAHSMGTTTEGGYLVTPTYRGDMLKEVLRNDTVLGRLGSTIITGLKGQFQMPKLVSGLTNYNLAENVAATETYVVVGLDTVDQKRISGRTKYGRQLFMNLDPSVGGFDQLLIKDLYDSANVKLDYDGINGTGLSNAPTGILHQSGPAAATLATIGWKQMINFKRLIAKAKGRKEDLKWAMSVDVESVLDITPKVAGQAIFLRSDDGKIAGYVGESSNQIPDAVAMLGFWPEFFTLLWGVEKLIVADQPAHSTDEIEISLHRYANFFLRSSESFAIADNAAIDVWNVD